MFTEALFTTAKTRKQPKCPSTEEWIKKMWYNGILLSRNKSEVMPFAALWMDPEIVILSEMSDREGKISYDITYMWNLKKWCKCKHIYETEIESQM